LTVSADRHRTAQDRWRTRFGLGVAVVGALGLFGCSQRCGNTEPPPVGVTAILDHRYAPAGTTVQLCFRGTCTTNRASDVLIVTAQGGAQQPEPVSLRIVSRSRRVLLDRTVTVRLLRFNSTSCGAHISSWHAGVTLHEDGTLSADPPSPR